MKKLVITIVAAAAITTCVRDVDAAEAFIVRPKYTKDASCVGCEKTDPTELPVCTYIDSVEYNCYDGGNDDCPDNQYNDREGVCGTISKDGKCSCVPL